RHIMAAWESGSSSLRIALSERLAA
ncbi:MAG: hypothetical protein QOG56_1884, partial [Solirubrobacteraceae bacterium]|nr:hypothetical protein [Solirubrobacteraceae bacterium]